MRALRRSEAGTLAVRRTVRGRVERALEHLKGRAPSDEAVHSARKELRKARAALRLLRKALSHRVFARENAALRDAASPLGAVRNSKVLLDRLDELVSRLEPGPLDDLRSRLQRERLQARRAWLGGTGSRTRRALHNLAARSMRWSVGRHGWSVLGAGIERTYARGRKALATAREEPSVEHLHMWRKQAKYLSHQLQFLEPLAPKAVSRLAREANRLSECLGLDHDLALLGAKVRQADPAAHPEHGPLLELIDECRGKQQALAFARGRRLYRQRSTAFTKSLETRWRAWKRGGESSATR